MNAFHHPPRSAQAFSMIELLVTISILAILGGSVGLAMVSLGSAGKLSTGTAAVSANLALSRGLAISQRQPTRFVVVTDWPGSENAAFSKFSIWRFERDSPTRAGTWVQAGPWERLPQGVLFDPNEEKEYLTKSPDLSANPQAIRGPDVVASSDHEFAFERDGVNVRTRFIEFGSRGNLRGLSASDSSAWLTLVEGYLSHGVVTYTRGGASPDNWRQVSVGALLGRANIFLPQ